MTEATAIRSGAVRPRNAWLDALLTPAGAGFGLILLLAAFGPLATPYGEAEINPLQALEPPTWAHPMGTDLFGRDVLTRVLYGARLSLLIGIAAALLGAVLGLAIGMVAGLSGGWLDRAAMSGIDVLLAFPGTLLAMVIVAMLGPSTTNLILAVGIATVPGYARLVRSMALSIRQADYVLAARSIGVRGWVIALRHVYPNLRASVVVYATLSVATAILNAAGLGFLGLGSKPPTAEWGLMVADGRETLELAWWVTTFPGLAILTTTLVIYALGDALNAALDPKREMR